MVWIVSDEAMKHLLGGDFTDVSVLCETIKDASIRTLYKAQDTYKSYQGFRKFFKRHMKPIIEQLCFIEGDGIVGKIIKYLSGV